MRPADMAWTGLRWLFALFFSATGLAVFSGLIFGWPPDIRQPTVPAQALYSALHQSGFMDPLLGASYLAGGAALAIPRTAPLGLVLLGPSVVVIFFFDTFLAHLPIPGLLTLAIWGLLVLRHISAYRGLWSYRLDSAVAKPTPPR